MADALPLVIYTDLEQQVEAMERDGYVYFPSVLAEDEIVELRDQSEQLEAVPEALDTDLTVEKDGHLNRCINAAFNRDPLFLKYLDKPGPIELAEAIHGPDCHIVSVHTWAVGTGRPDQQLHSDWLPAVMPAELRGDSRLEIPIYITTAHFYLDDMTEELGPTNIVLGSHLAGRRPHGPVEGDSNHGESEWNGVGGAELPRKRRRLHSFPKRNLASGYGECERPYPAHLHGPLFPPNDHSEVPALPALQVQSRGDRPGHAAPAQAPW